jgi:mRNA-degrading endonuclease RelE of RelBE toxin-antitoxin system
MRGSFEIVWDWAALVTFYRLPRHTATIVDRAVILLVESGQGRVEWVAPYHRLRAGFYEVALNVDVEQRIVNVIRIYRAR